MPNAPSAMNIGPLGCSVSFLAPLFDVIHRLQNSFVPIVYDTHVWHTICLIQPLQKPVTTITILSLRKCNSQWQQLIVAAATTVKIVPLYFPVKNVPSMQMMGLQCLNASM
jgi:hypothetical protein